VDDRIDGPVAEYLTDRADVGFVEVDTWRQRVCVAGRQISLKTLEVGDTQGQAGHGDGG